MIKQYKEIATLQKKDVKEGQPSHYLKAKVNKDDKEGVIVASLWSKSYDNNGVTKRFLSGLMSEPYQDRDGYVIVSQKDLNNLIKVCQEMKKQLGETPDDNYPVAGENGNSNLEDIPF
jgi:hypothetical protein